MKDQISKKEKILKSAMEFTSKFGLDSLSIGELAKSVGMSKSGLFSHFKSKEKLQIMVLDYAACDFTKKVIRPILKEPRGTARMDAMMNHWKQWSTEWLPGGCPFLSAVIEFDDRPGNIQNHLRNLLNIMIETIVKTIEISQEENQIRKDIDKLQMAFEIYSNILGHHVYSKFIQDEKSEQRFENTYQKIMANYKSQP